MEIHHLFHPMDRTAPTRTIPHADKSVLPKRGNTWFGRFWRTLKVASKDFIANDPMSKAATIAYYTIFSLPAVMIITIMVAATFYDEAAVRQALLDQAARLIGSGTAASMREMLENAQVTETKFFAKALGIGALVISAGTVVGSLQTTLNSVWGVEAKPGHAVWKYLTSRMISLALVGCMGFLVLVSLVLDAGLAAFGDRLAVIFSEGTEVMLKILNIILSFGIITFIFALIFRVLPDAKITWGDVWGGALLTAVLFTAGKFLIGTYIGLSGVGDTYGAAGAVVVILLWVYYSTVILIFGAHFTRANNREKKAGVVPSDHARKVSSAKGSGHSRS